MFQKADYQKKPFDQCYWIIPGKLLAGRYPTHTTDQLENIFKAGVSCFIDLTQNWELPPYEEQLIQLSSEKAKRLNFPIKDFTAPPKGLTKEILDTIDAEIADGNGVYVHCWGGRGRTGTIIGCWIKRHFKDSKIPLEDGSFLTFTDLWLSTPKGQKGYESPENNEQREQVRQWEHGE
jgi:hypothetical protein